MSITSDTLIGNMQAGRGNDLVIGNSADNDVYVPDVKDKIVETRDGGINPVRSYACMRLGWWLENLVLGSDKVQNGSGNSLANRITGMLAPIVSAVVEVMTRLSAWPETTLLPVVRTVALCWAVAGPTAFAGGRDKAPGFHNNIDGQQIGGTLWGGAEMSAAAALQEVGRVVDGNTVQDFGKGDTIMLNGVGDLGALEDDPIIF
nr:M10 family metallopeptidase C-terminal domain-containing protein [uncultured Paracoccus sp.]